MNIELGNKGGVMKRFLVLVFCTMAIGCTKTDISGRYDGNITVNSTLKSLGNIDFMLSQKGKDISGNMTFKVGPGGQFNITGLVDGNKVKFSTEMKSGLYISFDGVASEKEINGTADLSYFGTRDGTQHDKATFKLERT